MATYAHEQDELRQELRRNVAGAVTLWPKLGGEGNVLCSGATYTIHRPDGTQIQSGSATLTGIGTPAEYTRIDCVVSAIETLDEDYQARVTWTQTGGGTHFDMVSFDVVLYPWGPPSVSLNDILEERPDAAVLLERLGVRLGYSAADAPAAYAAILAVRARVELDALIREQMESQSGLQLEPGTITQLTRRRYTRPYLVLNRERLNRPERLYALAKLYAADMSSPEGDDESAALYRHYQAQAETAWRGVGPLRYDATEDLLPDSQISDIGRSRRMTRSW